MNLLGWLAGYARVGVSPQSIAFPPVKVSPFSGIVTTVTIYESVEQQLKLAINFATTESFLYSETVCPPFIGDCAKAAYSAPVQATLEIGGITVPRILFETVSSIPMDGTSVTSYRDVHGLVSGEKIFSTRIIELAALRGEYTMREIGNMKDELELDYASISSNDEWTITDVGLMINGKYVADQLSMQIEPGVRGMVLPQSMRDSIIGDLFFDGSSYVIPADYVVEIHIPKVSSIRLFGDPAIVVKFSETEDHMIVGDALIMGLDRIVYDYRNRRIFFGKRLNIRLCQTEYPYLGGHIS
jgi:hypothetical protein